MGDIILYRSGGGVGSLSGYPVGNVTNFKVVPADTTAAITWTDPDDINSPLKHCGVVYNEMCGVLTDGDQLYDEKLRAAMLPDTPYKYIFGGSPPALAKMTLDEIKRHQSSDKPKN